MGTAAGQAFSVGLRVPVQLDRQKADIVYSWGTEVQRATTLNFGVDGLAHLDFNSVGVYAGAGYFRNRFNIRRPYDAGALDVIIDTVPVGLKTDYYTYSLLRFPLGITYKFTKDKKNTISVGIEHVFNISLERKYAGGNVRRPGNDTYRHAKYFGSAANMVFSYSMPAGKRSEFAIQPFVRIFNIYSKDFISTKRNMKRSTGT